MTLNELLPRLSGVRHTSRGVLAICPAHDDRSPSLAVSEGQRGLLAKCFSGCTVTEICAALGLTTKDLFYDTALPRRARQPKPRRLTRNQIAFQLRFHGDKLFLRAQSVLSAATHLTITNWSDNQLDRALSSVASAYHDLEHADLLDQVAFSLRAKVILERINSDAA